MDQGLAAVWAGAAGLVGAGIGGGFALWGAVIGGRKTVEAAERQEQRAAAAEHQHWLRQERFTAYNTIMRIGNEITEWGNQVPLPTVRDVSVRYFAAMTSLSVLGPGSVSSSAHRMALLLSGAYDAMRSNPSEHTAGSMPWGAERSADFMTAQQEFRRAVAAVLGTPPT
jgi:hypothetical protein